MEGGGEISDLSFGLPPFGRVPSFGLRISDLKKHRASFDRLPETTLGTGRTSRAWDRGKDSRQLAVSSRQRKEERDSPVGAAFSRDLAL